MKVEVPRMEKMMVCMVSRGSEVRMVAFVPERREGGMWVVVALGRWVEDEEELNGE
jgi:hypothetical protein